MTLRPSSLAKAKASEAATLAVNEAVQLHGGIGMTDDDDLRAQIISRKKVTHPKGLLKIEPKDQLCGPQRNMPSPDRADAVLMAMGPLPWIICSEIFPAKLRGRAMSAATASGARERNRSRQGRLQKVQRRQ